MGCACSPLAQTPVQGHGKSEALAGRLQGMPSGNALPALSGYCGSGIVAAQENPSEFSGCVG